MINPVFLNKLFNNSFLQPLIPIFNTILTSIKNKKRVVTSFDKNIKRFIHIEDNEVIFIDTKHVWNLSKRLMKRSLLFMPCRDYIPKNGDVVIDIGAGVGSEVFLFHSLVGLDGKIIAIEAHPNTAFSLIKLIEFNKMNNVIIVQKAVGADKGTVFIENREMHVSNAISNEALNDGIQIDMVTFDSIIADLAIEKIDFVKVNIEGSEVAMIEGMSESIKKIENIAISCHDFLYDYKSSQIRKNMTNFLQDNGFVVSHYPDSDIVRNSWIYGKRYI